MISKSRLASKGCRGSKIIKKRKKKVQKKRESILEFVVNVSFEMVEKPRRGVELAS